MHDQPDAFKVSTTDRPVTGDSRLLVDQAARAFDEELHTRAYRETHSDSGHLEWMVTEVCTGEPGRVLDLGTGNGYVAMAVAERFPGILVTGVDVAAGATSKNIAAAAARDLTNVAFRLSDGITLPFPDKYFNGIASRYAFHHFPQPEVTLREVFRALQPGCRLVLADAVRDDRDDVDFINAFQILKQDGHVEMHRAGALVRLVQRAGFELEHAITTSLTFDRAADAAYDELIGKTPRAVLDSYAIEREGGKIRLTFPILSAVFVKRTD